MAMKIISHDDLAGWGFPCPAFNNFFKNYRVHLGECDRDKAVVYLLAERRDKPMQKPTAAI